MATRICMDCGMDVPSRYASRFIKGKWICEECREKEIRPPGMTGNESFMREIVVSTTPALEGYRITRYLGIVSAETTQAIGLIEEIAPDQLDVPAERSAPHVRSLFEMKTDVEMSLKRKADELGANAIVGVDFRYGDLRGSILVLVMIGTAVCVEPITSPAGDFTL